MKTDDILAKIGLKYEDLNKAERDSLNQMLTSVSQSKLTLDKLKEYIHQMRDVVENKLIQEPEFVRVLGFIPVFNRNQLLLKARLQNYLLFEAFLSTPEKAKAMLENALSGMMVKK